MEIAAQVSSTNLVGRVQRLQLLTIAWMMAEAIIALGAAWRARSPALLGFGGDSGIELLSAIVVLWRFRSSESGSMRAEKTAARITGTLLFLVAGFILITSAIAILGYIEPRPTIIGIVVLTAAAFAMPVLASQKRKIAAQLSSASLKADAAQSSLCGYLSWIALGGLVVNALLHKSWADPAAALILVPFVAKEGWEALHASRLACSCK